MKRLGLIIGVIFSVLSLASCADDSRFVVAGTTPGTDNMNLRYAYEGPGGFRQGIVAVRDGKFEFSGAVSQPVLVEMFTHDFKPLGYVWVGGGESVECTLVTGHPERMKARGTQINERWTAFLTQNEAALTESAAAANKAVAAFVEANPGDLLSALLLVTFYDASLDPEGAAGLMAKLHPSARPERVAGAMDFLLGMAVAADPDAPLDSLAYISTANSVRTLVPGEHRATLLLFTDAEVQRSDTLLEGLRSAAAGKGVAIADVYLSADTLAWRRMLRTERQRGYDSDLWTRGWLPGGLAAPQLRALGLPRLPYALVCDSTGIPVFRSSEPAKALDALKNRLKQ